MKKLLLSTALSLAIVYPATAEESRTAGGDKIQVIESSAGSESDAVQRAAEKMAEDSQVAVEGAVETAAEEAVEETTEAAAEEVEKIQAVEPAAADAEHEIQEKREAHGAGQAHWGYGGAESAPYWGTLDEAYHACGAGQAQSPINISKFLQEDLADIVSAYNPSSLSVVNNGHTIQVNFESGSSFSTDNMKYDLLQAHFHTPSEHYLDGAPYPMEVHFVHKAADGALGVIGVMMKVGEHNKVIEGIWQNAPINAGDEKNIESVKISATDLMPESKEYYKYEGSLTTPPCSEGVRWHVMKDPIDVSEGQLKAFQALFPVNARPVQALNDRVVTGD